ncbi:MAG TPA: cytochrome c maturation protein CcmE [Candidatus Kapabacteria bacterium]|nr:cytochrome c maturation protein CcmE [Candidatus Kapabacteria bacterium]
MKIKYIIGVAVAVVALAIAFFALDTKQIGYGTFATAEETGRAVQVRGTWVRTMPVKAENNTFVFYMRDDSARIMQVTYNGGKPNNFEMSKEVVCKGKVKNGVFSADDILTKCPSKYEATGDDLKRTGS